MSAAASCSTGDAESMCAACLFLTAPTLSPSLVSWVPGERMHPISAKSIIHAVRIMFRSEK